MSLEEEYAEQYEQRKAERPHGFGDGDRIVVKDPDHLRFKQAGRVVLSRYGCADDCALYCRMVFIDFGEGCLSEHWMTGLGFDERLNHSQIEHID